jgi:hypothetical protein|tara:strand:+ start:2365 stop:2661 length:297 start_codon:yes stop_codon:yes gene_type:complete
MGQLEFEYNEEYDVNDNGFMLTPHLKTRLRQVYNVLLEGDWVSIEAISERTKYNNLTSISARCRDLRKEKYGGHNVIGRYNADKIYEYRLVGPNETST